jgi:predicted aspartyl protease
VVPARLWGPRGEVSIRLALDTGATTTLLNWDIAVIAGYDPARVVERTQITTGSGVEFCPVLRVRSLEALGRRRKRFHVLCHTLPPSARVDGLLGLDFLRNCDLRVNFRTGVLSMD